MLRGQPPVWAEYLPGYGGSRVLLDGALTPGFDETAALLISLIWLGLLAILAGVLLRRGRPGTGS